MSSNNTGTGASNVNENSIKCSITKVTVSTKWKAPGVEADSVLLFAEIDGIKAIQCEERKAEAVVYYKYHPEGSSGKTIYLITSPNGKDITLNFDREDGGCPRPTHKKFEMSYPGCTEDDGNGPETVSYDTTTTKYTTVPTEYPANNFRVEPYEELLEGESTVKIKYFKISPSGLLNIDNLFYFWGLPIPLTGDKEYVTRFCHNTCKEGIIRYQIVSYPDINYKIEFALGTIAKKKSQLERSTSNRNYLPKQWDDLNNNSLRVNLDFSPSLKVTTSYNKGDEKLELTLKFDKDEEFFHCDYSKGTVNTGFGTEFFQHSTIKKIKDFCKFIDRIAKIDFLKELTDFKPQDLIDNYKPYTLTLNPPNVLLSYERKYQTSEDLAKIGNYIDFCFACKPFISITLTIDLLFLILSGATAGAATGFYVMLKNLDKVIKKILGNTYKKKYENSKPFEADVYFNFKVSGIVNGLLHWPTDTTKEENAKSQEGIIEGILKADLEAGAKCSFDTFSLTVERANNGYGVKEDTVYGGASFEAGLSASGSTGIKIKLGFEDHLRHGKGIDYFIEGIFLGLIVKSCAVFKVGLWKIINFGVDWEGEATLLPVTSLFSWRDTFFETQE